MSCLSFAVAVALLAGTTVHTIAQPRALTVQEVEAAYLYQFGTYAEWPADARSLTSTFDICLLDADPLHALLIDITQGRRFAGQPIGIRDIGDPEESRGCRVLFVGQSDEDDVARTLSVLEGQAILTVGRGPRFTRHGGIIGLITDQRRIRFVVNLVAAETAGIRMNSQLLRVAADIEQ